MTSYYNSYDPLGSQANTGIGCSAAKCTYSNTNIFGKETWMNSQMILASNFSNVLNYENNFNLLIPIRSTTSGATLKYPKRLVIAFCDFSKTSLGVTNQLKILSAYRVYGATTNGDITKPIQVV